MINLESEMDTHPSKAAANADRSALAEASRNQCSCRGQRAGRVVVIG